MQNKISLLLFLLLNGINYAQNTTNSPYSSQGLGERGGIEHTAFVGIGNSAITYFDSTVLNFYNPSTYNTLGKGQPIFSLGLTSRTSFFEENGNKQVNYYAFIEHFAMGFTLKKHFGLAIGLRPFTQKGYEIHSRVPVGSESDSIDYTYLGSGNANEVFVGLSSNLIDYKNSKLSVGGNLGYIFGSSTNERRSLLVGETTLGGVDYTTNRMKAFHYDLGAYFSQKFSNHTITLAMTVEPAQSLDYKQNYYLFYGKVDDPRTYDTLQSNTGKEGTFSMAPSTNFGINYKLFFQDKRENNTYRNSELSVHLNYNSTDWTKFSNSLDSGVSLLSSSRISFGIQYVPEKDFIENALTASFLERARYRFGFYSGTLPYSFNGVQYKDMGITAGIGIPVTSFRTLSCVNLGFSYGTRSNSSVGAFNEKYIGINLGVSLAPSNFDRWFVKRKLD